MVGSDRLWLPVTFHKRFRNRRPGKRVTAQAGYFFGVDMSKRFYDTELWKKPWFRKLSPCEKAAWSYINANCDTVGVWVPDYEAAEFYIGDSLDWESFIDKCNDNITVLDNNKWWLCEFCSFQYGELSEESRPHQSYIKLLKQHGLYELIGSNEKSTNPHAMRRKVTGDVRQEIYNRDRGMCVYCNEEVSIEEAHIDHFVPISKGGNSEYNNLVLSCSSCNSKKSNMIPDDVKIKHPDMANSIDRVSRYIETLSGVSYTPKEKEKDKEKEKEKEKERKNLPIYGQGFPVRLSDDERANIVKRYSEPVLLDFIERLSTWQPKDGKRGKNDYLTLLNWLRRDRVPEVQETKRCKYCTCELLKTGPNAGTCQNDECELYHKEQI